MCIVFICFLDFSLLFLGDQEWVSLIVAVDTM